MKQMATIFCCAAFSLFCLATCGSESEDSDETEAIEKALEQENGGLTFDDESPNFGDPFFNEASVGGEDSAFKDNIGNSEEFKNKEGENGARHFVLAITWGNHNFDPEVKEWTIWDGNLTVDKGFLVVVRTILFEEGEEIKERADKGKIEWLAKTKPHIDGIIVKYLLPASDKDWDASFTFKAGPADRTFKLSQFPLSDQEGFDPVNRVMYHGYEIKQDDCAHGFMIGRWHNFKSELGTFRGRWINETGSLYGHLKGVWGKNKKSDKLFFGKYIDKDGKFKGLLFGQWGVNEGHRFRGHWLNKEKIDMGTFAGIYQQAQLKVKNGGFFIGTWHEKCPANK